jgi:hypothetical protein
LPDNCSTSNFDLPLLLTIADEHDISGTALGGEIPFPPESP